MMIGMTNFTLAKFSKRLLSVAEAPLTELSRDDTFTNEAKAFSVLYKKRKRYSADNPYCAATALDVSSAKNWM